MESVLELGWIDKMDFKMCLNRGVGIGLYCLMSSCALALSPTSKIIAFSGGPAWYHAGHTQTISLQPNYANTYAAITPTQVLASGELFLGIQRPFTGKAFWQLGLALAASSEARLQGDIWETADPAFDNFTYQYETTHAHLALKTKWLFRCVDSTLLPYLSGSLGVATNQSHRFSMSPLIFEVLPVPGFQNHQETAFTYTLGVGVHKVLNPQWQVGMGYEFADWGRSSLSRAPGQTVGHGLGLNHLETQQLQFVINYSLDE